MDATTITLIGGIIVTIIASLATAIVQVLTAARVTRIDSRMDIVASDTEAIKGHVNSEKTAAEGRENTLKTENKLLQQMLDEQKSVASLLAQAAAVRGRDAYIPSAPITTPAVAPVLASIDKNTEETAKNTERTEAKVDAIVDSASPLEKLVASGRLTQSEADALKLLKE